MVCSSPCASCKLLRRRCAQDCIFAPYFPRIHPYRFDIDHKVFGASNELPADQRADAGGSWFMKQMQEEWTQFMDALGQSPSFKIKSL